MIVFEENEWSFRESISAALSLCDELANRGYHPEVCATVGHMQQDPNRLPNPKLSKPVQRLLTFFPSKGQTRDSHLLVFELLIIRIGITLQLHYIISTE